MENPADFSQFRHLINGWTPASRIQVSPHKMIEKYAILQLSDDAMIEKMTYSEDASILTETLYARIVVDQTDAEKMFNEAHKQYDYKYVLPGEIREFDLSEQEFNYYVPRLFGVTSFYLMSTTGCIDYIFLKPVDGKTTICLTIYYLGLQRPSFHP